MASEEITYITTDNTEDPGEIVHLNLETISLETGATQTIGLVEDATVVLDWAHGGHLYSPLMALQLLPSSDLNNGNQNEEMIMVQTPEEVVDYQDTDNPIAGEKSDSETIIPGVITESILDTTSVPRMSPMQVLGPPLEGNPSDLTDMVDHTKEIHTLWEHKHIQVEAVSREVPSDFWASDNEGDKAEEGLSTQSSPDYSQYLTGKKFPPEGLPGIDLSDPKQLAELTSTKPKKPNEDLPRPVTCSYKGCGKTFRDNAAMRKHLHIHGPRVHVCAECGKAFVESSKLKRHQLVHTGEKPYQCTFEGCGRRFSLDFNLRTHMRIHTGDKPYVCPFDSCTKKFAQSTNLKSHILTHAKPKNE